MGLFDWLSGKPKPIGTAPADGGTTAGERERKEPVLDPAGFRAGASSGAGRPGGIAAPEATPAGPVPAGNVEKLDLRRENRGDALDLTRHVPDEFAGKSVTLNGREYLISANVRTTDQGHAHRLVNRLSGLCLHMIQIRRAYRVDPQQALEASHTKQAATARLRDSFRVEGKGHEVTPLTVFQAHGGSFEVHEIPWGMFGHDTPPPKAEDVTDALEKERAGNVPDAIRILERVVLDHPSHSVALNNLAAAHYRLGHYNAALKTITRAIEVEPNHIGYRGAQISIAARCGKRLAHDMFLDLKQRFPHVRDCDALGVELLLHAGEPDRAWQLVQSVPLPPANRDALSAAVQRALQVRTRFNALRLSLTAHEHRGLDEERVLRSLEDLHAESNLDPELRANLGFRLRAAGQLDRAYPLLLGAADGIAPHLAPSCYANAGYCLLALRDWQRAMLVLDITMSLLSASGKDPHPVDIPGLAAWISDHGVTIETKNPSAAELLARGLQECPDKSLIPPSVERMAASLLKFAAMVQPPVRPAPR